MAYTDLARVTSELDGDAAENIANEQAYIVRALHWVTQRIDTWPSVGFEFAPRLKTRYVNALTRASSYYSRGTSFIDSSLQDDLTVLPLQHPLLEVVEVKDGLGNVLVAWDGQPSTRADADFYLYPRSDSPWWSLRMLPTSARRWTDFDGDPVEAISITAVEGYRTHYNEGEGWLDSLDSVQDDDEGFLTAEATLITITDAAGADARARTPRFSPGQWWQIEEEIVEVLAINTVEIEPESEDDDPTTIQQATVLRGQRGTTAVEHAQDTVINVWTPEPMIERAATRWVSYLYKQRGDFVAKRVDGFTTIMFPVDAPGEVAAILNTFAKDSPSEDDEWVAV